MPKVSVIIPNYNHALYLKQRIQSVLNQTFQDFEIILLDDCSTDNSKEIIYSFKNNPKISSILINEQNSGSTFKQWQKGLAKATGEYIWIAESDDYADELFLETLIKPLDTYLNVGIAYCQSWLVDENGQIISSGKERYGNTPCSQVCEGEEILIKYMTGANLIPNTSAVLFKREVALSIDDQFTHFTFSGDWWFWCEMLLRSDIIHICKELNNFRIHQNKVTVVSAKKGLYFTEGLQVLNLIKQNIDLPKKVYINKSKNLAASFVYGQLGNKLHNKLSFSTVIKVVLKSIRINRIFLRRIIFLIAKEKFHLGKRAESF